MLLLPLWLFAAPDAKMKISKEVDQRVSIAVVDSSTATPVTQKLHSVLVSDLKISGHFKPENTYYQGSYNNGISPAHRAKSYLLKYTFSQNGSGALLQIKLLGASNSRVILEKKYTIPTVAKYPFIAHRAVTDINKALGFRSIEWINRYVVYTRYTGKKQSEILLADYTFHFSKPVVRGGLNLFPQWGDPDQRGFYYTSYETGTPTLYHLDIYTGKRHRIIASEGMLICSDVSNNGNRLLLTMAPHGQPDIYEYDVSSGKTKQLTSYSGIDVNGKYSDNEQALVFVSDRLGRPNIYKKRIGSRAVSQLIFHGKKNSSCDTYGKRIVYASKEGPSRYNIYLANSMGGGIRPLTSTGINQFPRFAPDGETVLYIKRDNGVNAIGYIGLQTNQTMLFPLGNRTIQSIDW